MKIEIAENLIYSYLKHIEGCRIVQTNWKTSGEWSITEYDKKQARMFFNKINNSNEFKNIFGNSSFEQLSKQAEIDILGLNTTENTVYGIDVAFHAAGLNYKGVDGSTNKVMMKIFRTIFIMKSYFSGFDKFNSYFVSPKVNPAVYSPIIKKVNLANSIINDELISVKFIANEHFYETIVDPLVVNIKDEHDTGELFSRALKLLQLDPRESHKNDSQNNIKIRKNITKKNKTTDDRMKIGQFVQCNIRKLFADGLITDKEIVKLQNKKYSKEIFDQNYEFLRSNDKKITGNDGRNRYYAKEKFCNGYYLTSQWVERHWKPFKRLDKHN